MKELFAYYYPITIVYTTVFITLGMVLLFGAVPRMQRLHNYVSGRHYFSASYLFLGILGIIELATWDKGVVSPTAYTYVEVFPMAMVSMIHIWLNGYAYLLMLNPSRPTRRRVLLFGRAGLPLIFAVGTAFLFLPADMPPYGLWLLDLIYTGEVGWIFCLCRLEYSINVKALDNYYDEPERLGWMNGVIIFTLVLAFFNLLQYHIPAVGVPLRVANIVFYIYFAVRIMDYIPTFLSIEKVTPSEFKEDESCILTERLSKGNPQKELVQKQYYYPDNMPELVEKWTTQQLFCQENLTIADTARQMNTNRNYLSAYLNHGLGLTYTQWLNALRVQHAQQLFREHPGKNISEIGIMVGIPEVYNFSRHFRQITGMSPQKWLEK